MNQFKSFMIMVIMTLLLIFIGYLIGNEQGMILGFAIAFITNFISYFFSDKIVLATYGAKPVVSDHRLYRIVKNLTLKANMPMPKVCEIQDNSPNAFATGRNPHHAAVCATSGILRLLTDDELEGVLAHELSHIKNRDILVSSIAAGLCGIITILCRFAYIFSGRNSRENSGCATIIALMLGSLTATLMQLWLSRTREYMADESGAKMCGKPWALADALEKLAQGINNCPMENSTPETRNMFIVNPIAPTVRNLFSTHPPIDERINRLRNMSLL